MKKGFLSVVSGKTGSPSPVRMWWHSCVWPSTSCAFTPGPSLHSSFDWQWGKTIILRQKKRKYVYLLLSFVWMPSQVISNSQWVEVQLHLKKAFSVLQAEKNSRVTMKSPGKGICHRWYSMWMAFQMPGKIKSQKHKTILPLLVPLLEQNVSVWVKILKKKIMELCLFEHPVALTFWDCWPEYVLICKADELD